MHYINDYAFEFTDPNNALHRIEAHRESIGGKNRKVYGRLINHCKWKTCRNLVGSWIQLPDMNMCAYTFKALRDIRKGEEVGNYSMLNFALKLE